MTALKVLVVDDEPLVRSGLRALIEQDKSLVLIGEGRDGNEAVELIGQLKPDVLLLDVQMPERDGFEVLEEARSRFGSVPPVVVFVTAFDAYAIKAFDVHAVDYLLKPFDEERFRVAMERVRQRLAERTPAEAAEAVRAVLSAVRERPRYWDRITVKGDGRITVLPVQEVEWFEAADNYVCIHARSARYRIRESMKALEEGLNPALFGRVHRSAIVNLTRVRELQPMFGGEYVILLTSGAKITLSRGYRDAFRAKLGGSW